MEGLIAIVRSFSFSNSVVNLLQKGLPGEVAPHRNLPSIHKFYSMNLPTIFKVRTLQNQQGKTEKQFVAFQSFVFRIKR